MEEFGLGTARETVLLLQAKGHGAETLQWLRGIASGHKQELRYDDDPKRGLNRQMGLLCEYSMRDNHPYAFHSFVPSGRGRPCRLCSQEQETAITTVTGAAANKVTGEATSKVTGAVGQEVHHSGSRNGRNSSGE